MEQSDSKKIGVATATITGMNAMIGAGIFTAPAAIASYVGPAAIVSYILVVISICFMALSFARLSALFPQEGSFYTYAKQWGGHAIGLLAGFSYFVGLLIAMGLLAQVAGSYLHRFFPGFSHQTLSLSVLGLLIILNMFGAVLSEIGQRILIITTLFPLVATTLMCFTKTDISNLTPFAPYGIASIFKATRIFIFGFFGFECAASLFSIVKNPARNVPRALTYSILMVGLIYMLFVVSLIFSIPLSYFGGPRTPLTETLSMIFPHNTWILITVHIAMLSAVLGTVHSMIWSSSALFVSLMKKIKNNKNTPVIINQQTAVLVVGFCIFLSCVLLKNIDLFFNITAIGIVFALILSMITLLTIKSEWESGQNIKTIIGIGTASTILYFACEGLVLELAKII